VDGDILLLQEELEVEAFQAGVGIPVDLSKVVAGGIGAKVGELDCPAALGTAPFTLELTGERSPRDERQPLQPSEEGFVKKGGCVRHSSSQDSLSCRTSAEVSMKEEGIKVLSDRFS
jgi:hypothetical protein